MPSHSYYCPLCGSKEEITWVAGLVTLVGLIRNCSHAHTREEVNKFFGQVD